MNVVRERRTNEYDRRAVNFVEVELKEFDPVSAVRQAMVLLEYAQFFDEWKRKQDIQNAELFCRKALDEIEK